MNHPKIVSLKEILYNVSSDPIVFTNGCFDMFHAGHAHMLKSIKRSAPLDAKLVVGINSDESVRANKGPDRPSFARSRELIWWLATNPWTVSSYSTK
jgi:cytidyltransferase-like protein